MVWLPTRPGPPSPAGDSDRSSSPCSPPPAAAGRADRPPPRRRPSAVFPATVTHEYGETVVEEAPERVVSLGYTDQDAILALGTVPVAIREFTGNRPSATWPWAADRLKGEQPEVLPAERGHAGGGRRARARPHRRDHREPDPRAVRRLLEDRPHGRRPGGHRGRRGVVEGRDEADRRRARPARLRPTGWSADVEEKFVEVEENHPELAGATVARRPAEPDGRRVVHGVELEGPARAVPQGASARRSRPRSTSSPATAPTRRCRRTS